MKCDIGPWITGSGLSSAQGRSPCRDPGFDPLSSTKINSLPLNVSRAARASASFRLHRLRDGSIVAGSRIESVTPIYPGLLCVPDLTSMQPSIYIPLILAATGKR